MLAPLGLFARIGAGCVGVAADVPGHRFYRLETNLPGSLKPLAVWHRCDGCADIENRIKEIGDSFGMKRRDCKGFWATEALHQMAITAYNLCVLLQRQLGQEDPVQLQTLRLRLFTRAAVWSRAQGRPALK